MSNETFSEAPPEEAPDEGMGTTREEWDAKPETDPKLDDDFGMSAGYPIINNEAIPHDPGEPPDEMETPPAEAMQGAPFFSEAAHHMPGPESVAEPKPEVQQFASVDLVDTMITDADLKALWERADRAQVLIHKNIKALRIARQQLDLIQTARNEILSGKDRYEEAERFINEVEYRVEISTKVDEWSKYDGPRLLAYEIIWAIISFSVLFFWMSREGVNAVFLENNSDFVYFIGCMMWGGIGGVIGALISLVKHIAILQDYDHQHMIWYIASPIIGYGVGAVIFLIIRAGLISLTGPGSISDPFFMYMLAWLGGYQQNIFTNLLKRILKLFQVSDKDG